MKKSNQSNYRLKKAVNSLLFRNPSLDPPSRKTLMHQIKNLILTNKQLNHRFMDFNYAREYKQMHKTMTRFNSEQNCRKNLVSKLSKENKFFTKSYPNVIASLAIKVDKKNINYQTISIFNQKYEPTSISVKEKNFFFEDPLLLSKSKDLDNFYINEKITDTKNDESLNYSRKLLLEMNSNSPLNRVIKIIEKYKQKRRLNKTTENTENNDDILLELNNLNKNIINNNNHNNNISTENQSISNGTKNFFRNKYSFFNKYNNKINKEKIEEIKNLKKYNKSIKKMLNTKIPERKNTQKNINVLKLSTVSNDDNKINTINNYNLKLYSNNHLKKNKFNTTLSSKNLINKISKKFENIKSLKVNEQNNAFMDRDLEKIIPSQNKKNKSIKHNLMNAKELKGSIQIQNIYKDLAKTKETVYEYEKEKKPKFKYLYSLFNNKKIYPFQKEEKENIKIKKLDRDLFWTVNEFHIN